MEEEYPLRSEYAVATDQRP